MDPVLSAALGRASDVADSLGLWQKLLAKLLGDPNVAATQLAVALHEVRRTLSSLREAILEVSYLGVAGQDPVDVRRALDRIETGALYEEVIRAKGSCGKIFNIYDRHLRAWFKRLLKPKENAALEELFTELGNSDGWAVDALEKLLDDAKPMAREIRGLLESGDEAGARERVVTFTKDFRPDLEKLSQTIAFMLELENQFIYKGRLT